MERPAFRGAVLAALVLLACGADKGPGDEPGAGGAAADGGGTTTVTTAGDGEGTTATAEAPTTTTTFPTAADGDHVDACYDGDCEVVVTAGTEFTFNPALRLLGATIDAVGPGGVDMTARTGGSTMVFRQMTPGGVSAMNDTEIRVLGIEGDRAVIRLSPASPAL